MLVVFQFMERQPKTVWVSRHPSKDRGPVSISDIALPQALVRLDGSPRLHHVDRSLVLKIDIGNAELGQDILASRKRDGFADHKKRKLEETDRAGAHRARRKRRVHYRVVKRDQSGVAHA